MTDPNNCGTCGNTCKPNAGSTVSCDNGACRQMLICPTGMGDCDSDPTNGCETNIATDKQNCGACGKNCGQPGIGVTLFCAQGICEACAGVDGKNGTAECDGDPTNGCESLLTNENCGGCGIVCAPGETCINCGNTCVTHCFLRPEVDAQRVKRSRDELSNAGRGRVGRSASASTPRARGWRRPEDRPDASSAVRVSYVGTNRTTRQAQTGGRPIAANRQRCRVAAVGSQNASAQQRIPCVGSRSRGRARSASCTFLPSRATRSARRQ